ncbi:hypothetical protein [Clostridium butyricum]|uniref:hypothetical protein n=1 Tax=Clostridium butyricum TaxID=1492 RepID=UPI002AB21516|nr:hypothetical protein [Clostridium butyricum]
MGKKEVDKLEKRGRKTNYDEIKVRGFNKNWEPLTEEDIRKFEIKMGAVMAQLCNEGIITVNKAGI